MTIQFDITDSEADAISIQYAFDGLTDKNEFVLEQFKKFGRDCVVAQASQIAQVVEKTKRDEAVDIAKSSLSF